VIRAKVGQRIVLVGPILTGALIGACADPGSSPTPPATPIPIVTPTPEQTPTPAPTPVTIVAVGDITCGEASYSSAAPDRCQQRATSDLVLSLQSHRVLTIGDNVNGYGRYSEFIGLFDPTWGRFKNKILPIPGNHEYEEDRTAKGYFDYFNGVGVANGVAGERIKGYRSFEMGSWHIVALNSNCAKVDCVAEAAWLRNDLATHPAPCTLAYFHHPLFSSPPVDEEGRVIHFWQALHDFRADVILNGHMHNYQRFAPLTPNGVRDDQLGIRQFIVGTGGYSHYRFTGLAPNTEVRNDTAYGVLEMMLKESGYSWRFVPVAGGGFTDSGEAQCH
jgi:hypothetical protein